MSGAEFRIGVLASGRGSNFRALCEAGKRGGFPGRIVVLVTDKPGAGALDVAREHGIEALTLAPRDFPSREAHEEAVARALDERKVGLVCLAGYMRIVGKALLDETQLRNAFQNLVKNCCEAMSSEISGGELRIRTRLAANEAGRQVPEAFSGQVVRGDSNLVVEIEDTGPGMPKEVLDKVFTPFFTTKAGGTGLGMSIAHKSITDHWGFLDIESRPGKGTRFIITLPLYRHAREGELNDG